MLRRSFVLLIALIATVFFSSAALNAAGAPNKDRVLTVMTQNMDAGTDFYYLLALLNNPHTDADIFSAVTATYIEMHFSNVPQRADGIAAKIQAAQPDIVALQEVTTLTTENMGPMQPPIIPISDDALASLMTALQARGLHYTVLASQENARFRFPGRDPDTGALIFANITDSDVILVRDDLQVSDFKLENTQQAQFANFLTFQITPMPSVSLIRGWISVDAKLRGKVYRFVTTHLESLSPDIQAAQTEELLAGPLDTDLPVILAGDLNSDAHAPSWTHGPAYGILTAAGFDDIWNELYPAVAGFTWPMYLEDNGLNAGPLQRIDLILTKGDGIQPRAMLTIPSLTPIRASDHSGVLGSVVLLP